MTLKPGTRLGPYQIGEALGAGGMGEVYRARDTRLDRSVAIKVVPQHLAGRPDLKERFEREARTISSLNHPHLCALYDIGSQDDVDYLVMELLEGETLADRLASGRGRTSRGTPSGAPAPEPGSDSGATRALKLEEALQIAMQVADGLDCAHRQGVVHRDLKPGNIMLTKSGAKLLDFGLAKQTQPAAAMGSSLIATEAVRPITAEGTILGTVQYMAPEQLEGQEADARTDVFAFGAVLYEMVTGRRAFEGKSTVSLIAAIVDHDPPPLSSLAPVSPPLLDHLVKTCLAKNPDKRWQSMADVLLQLRLIADPGARLNAAGAGAPASGRSRLAWIGGCVACALMAAAATAVLMPSDALPVFPTIEFDVATPAYNANNQIALSPAGTHLVASVSEGAQNMLWLRTLANQTGRTLPGTEGVLWPFWSPDGRQVAFFASGKLKRVDLQGAPPQSLADAANGTGGTWNRNDVIVFAPTGNGPLFRVSAAGGVAAPLTELDKEREETAHRHPWFLPDGRHFLYVAISSTPENSGIFVASLDSPKGTRLVASQFRAAFAPPDSLLFIRESDSTVGGTLMAQRFDPDRLELAGEPFPVAQDVGMNSPNSGGGFAVSDTGMLVYRIARTPTERSTLLKWFDRQGGATTAVESPAEYQNPALSPDGRYIVVGKAGVPRKLFDVMNRRGQWDVTRDGQRFLINVAADQTTSVPVVIPIRVILNWDRRDTPAGP